MVTVPRYVVLRPWSNLLTVRIRRWSRRPPESTWPKWGNGCWMKGEKGGRGKVRFDAGKWVVRDCWGFGFTWF
ncbi:hypothetical protein V6N13_122657 [Hibiscus sabdariffa]